MCHHTSKAIIFGLGLALAACNHDPTNIPTESDVANAEAGVVAGSTNLAQASNTWMKKQSLFPWRQSMAAGTINGIIYVVGGRRQSPDYPYTVTPLARVDAYRVATNTWSQVGSLPGIRMKPNGASAINGKLYVSGGLNRDFRSTKTLFVYDPKMNSWMRKADMPLAGCGGIQGVIGGQLYIYMPPRGTGCFDASSDLGVVFRYNPTTNTWVRRAAPPIDHENGVGGVINGKFYLAGGNNNTLHVYDPTSNTWMTRAPMSASRSGMAAAVLDEKLFLVGGEGWPSDYPLSTVEVYDPVTNRWTMKAPLPIGTVAGAAAMAGAKIFYISGVVHDLGGGTKQPWAPGPSEVYAYTP
jgi:N-acetylneuraminic acid mutarotase